MHTTPGWLKKIEPQLNSNTTAGTTSQAQTLFSMRRGATYRIDHDISLILLICAHDLTCFYMVSALSFCICLLSELSSLKSRRMVNTSHMKFNQIYDVIIKIIFTWQMALNVLTLWIMRLRLCTLLDCLCLKNPMWVKNK